MLEFVVAANDEPGVLDAAVVGFVVRPVDDLVLLDQTAVKGEGRAAVRVLVTATATDCRGCNRSSVNKM